MPAGAYLHLYIVCMCMHMHMYMYMYTHTYTDKYKLPWMEYLTRLFVYVYEYVYG